MTRRTNIDGHALCNGCNNVMRKDRADAGFDVCARCRDAAAEVVELDLDAQFLRWLRERFQQAGKWPE